MDDYKIEVENFTSCGLDRIENFRGQKVKIAGIVTQAQHRINKKGNGWGLFTIQDYNGVLEFPLFTEDYQKFKHLLEKGAVLYLTGIYQKRWNSEEYQLKLTDVKQLDSIGTDMTESITLKLPIENISENLIDEIEMICKTRKGKHKLKMVLLDKQNQLSLNLIAQQQKVNADSEFIDELDRIGIGYKVN